MIPASMSVLVVAAVMLLLSFEGVTWAAYAAIAAAAVALLLTVAGLVGRRRREGRVHVPSVMSSQERAAAQHSRRSGEAQVAELREAARSSVEDRESADELVPVPRLSPPRDVDAAPSSARKVPSPRKKVVGARSTATSPKRVKAATAKRSEAAVMRDALEAVSGLGPKKTDLLIAEFGSLDALRAAGRDGLLGLAGFGPSLTGRILKAIR